MAQQKQEVDSSINEEELMQIQMEHMPYLAYAHASKIAADGLNYIDALSKNDDERGVQHFAHQVAIYETFMLAMMSQGLEFNSTIRRIRRPGSPLPEAKDIQPAFEIIWENFFKNKTMSLVKNHEDLIAGLHNLFKKATQIYTTSALSSLSLGLMERKKAAIRVIKTREQKK